MGVISNGLGSTNIKDGRGFVLLTVFTVPTTVEIEPFAAHFFINGLITSYLLTFLLSPRKNRQIFIQSGVVIVLAVFLGSL